MNNRYDKRLPIGNFIFINNVAQDASESSIAEWLGQYLPLSVDHVAVGHHLDRNGNQSILVSFDGDATAHLLKWAFENVTFPGADRPLEFNAMPVRSRRD